jgi:hypothetical protein
MCVVKIWISPYKLAHRAPLNRHEKNQIGDGFLIKLQTKDFAAGYADCRPWGIFGDPDVQSQINFLQRRRLTPLLKRSLFFASIDGVAREEKRSLWDSQIRIRSHYTISSFDEMASMELLSKIWQNGFRTIKLKLGRDLNKEVSQCNRLAEKSWFRWRLDFNGQGGEIFLKQLSPLFLSQVDFVEDPEAYNEERWQRIEQKFSIRLAIDQPELTKEILSKKRMRVIKPARQNMYARAADVITNSLDHPVGQSFAALQAQQSLLRLGKQKVDYGLKSDHLFLTTPYFERLQESSPFFKPDINYGIGFDDLLEREPWTSI